MDITTFVVGYFIGLALGAGAVIAWTSRYGRISLKSLATWWHDIADWTHNTEETSFASRRHHRSRKHPAE